MCKAIEDLINDSREEGLEEGLERGKQEDREEIAQRMLERCMSMEDITFVTGLTEAEILALAHGRGERSRQ